MATPVHRNALPSGHRLHWYEIRSILGQGGFGITYLARDGNLGVDVAIKEYLPVEFAVREADASIHPVTGEKAEQYDWGLERFISEARTLAKFRHPNLVRVSSVFTANNTAYMVMDYEQGGELKTLLDERKTLEEDELIQLVLPLLGALAVVHDAGFIHRDIKPANILIRPDGSPVLIDFGSARQSLGAETHTLTSVVSPGYAPYEQYVGDSSQQGAWTDIYGLGATLYRAVTGKVPNNALDRGTKLLANEPDPLRPTAEVAKGNYSNQFLAAIDHALAFNRNERPQTLNRWRHELSVSAATEQVTSQKKPGVEELETHINPATPPPKPVQAKPVAVDSAVATAAPKNSRAVPVLVFLLLLMGLGGYAFWQQDELLGFIHGDERAHPVTATTAAEPLELTPPPAIPAVAIAPPVEDPPPITTGHLQVSVNQAAEVFIDGALVGLANASLPWRSKAINAGEYLLELRADGFVPLQITATVAADQWTDLALELEPALGSLVVRSNVSGDRLSIDGKVIGSTGKTVHSLTPGEHQITVEKPGYQAWTQTVTVAAARTTTLRATLTADFNAKACDYCPEMVKIPGGTFRMGDIQGGGGSVEKPVHSVTIQPFAMGKYEVTFAEYDRFTQATNKNQADDENWGRGNRPVINVSHEEATAYAVWLSDQTGKTFRLPSEAEWEYAARAGSESQYSWGNSINCSQARYGYVSDECGKQLSTDPVGSFAANRFGLHDLHGNVWEWTQDCWNDSYAGAPNNGAAWRSGDCARRVVRGGSWLNDPVDLRAAYRNWRTAVLRNVNLGFRLVQDL